MRLQVLRVEGEVSRDMDRVEVVLDLMSQADWSEHVSHVIEANEFYVQYGMPE